MKVILPLFRNCRCSLFKYHLELRLKQLGGSLETFAFDGVIDGREKAFVDEVNDFLGTIVFNVEQPCLHS